MANHQSEVEKLSASIAALEAQRAMLGDAVVDPAIAALRQQISQTTAAIEKETPEDERKLVTIVFADISGFTALSERKDPEEVRELMNACFQSLVPIVQKYEGMIDKYLGDGFLASWTSGLGFYVGAKWAKTGHLFGGKGQPALAASNGAAAVRGEISPHQMAQIVARVRGAAAMHGGPHG